MFPAFTVEQRTKQVTQKKEEKMSRRQFLKTMGLASLAFAAFPISGKLIELSSSTNSVSLPEVRFVSGVFDPKLFAWAMEQPAPSLAGRWRRKWVMFIDLERCDGCGLCTDACNMEHEVPAGQTWIKVLRVQDNPLSKPYPLPRPCMQCENAPCVKVCPVGATYYNEDGVVLINEDRCIGCRMCMAACPYGARYFNWEQPVHSTREHEAETYSPETYPHKHRVGVVEKCMFCSHRYKEGILPACVLGCPMRALFFGDLDEDVVLNGSETWKILETLEKRHAFRLLEELGTEPRVYYLAPSKGHPKVTAPLLP